LADETEGIARATVADYAIRGSQSTAGGYEEPQIDGVLGERIYQVDQHETDKSLVIFLRG
jgi:hypothetical protein